VLYEESHALLISASNYDGLGKRGWAKLPNTALELDEVAEALRPHGFSVTRVYDPTGEELVRVFRQFLAQHGQKTNVRLLVFFSGHGYTNPANDFGYLVPIDAKDPRIDFPAFLYKALPISQVDLWAREVTSRHAIFIFDSCFSGSIFLTRSVGSRPDWAGGNESDRWQFLQGKSQEPVRQFIAAGDAKEELPGRSSFVPLFLQGLRYGVPIQPDGYITGKGLGQWIEQSLPSLTGGRQNPHSGVIRDPSLSFGDMVFQVPNWISPAGRSRPQSATSADSAGAPLRRGHCDNLVFDIESGLLSGLPPNLSREAVKRELPCFSGETEDGIIANYGGGVFFGDFDFYFYTFQRFLNIRSGFRGRTSIPLFGRTRVELRSTLPFGAKYDRPYWADKKESLEFIRRKWGCLILEFHGSGKLSELRAFTVDCPELREYD
jgi:hypothetical protein